MAGFDVEVEINASHRPLADALLRGLQALARDRGVSVRFRGTAASYDISVNGSLFAIQAIVDSAGPFLLGLSTGFPRPREPRTRRSVCERLLSAIATGASGISTLVGEASDLVAGGPCSYRFDVGGATDLAGSMQAFSSALVLYHNGQVAPVHLAENAHTAVETLLRRVLGRDSRGKSFEAMVRDAASRSCLTPELVAPILELKTIRRDAKHRGQGVRPEKLQQLLAPILRACHALARAVRQGARR